MAEAKQPLLDDAKRFAEDLKRHVRSEPTVILGTIVAFAVMGFWAWRIKYGVDLTDESLYLATPLRFALGDRPFFDDRTSIQGAGLLMLPLVFAYRLFVRSNEGLVLFMRTMYLLYLLGLGLVLANALRRWLSRGTTMAVGALVCFFAPYCMYQFSYNTLGAGLGMLAAFCVLRLARADVVPTKHAAHYAVLAGAAVAGSALSYPTMLVLVPVHFVTLMLFGRRPLGWWKTPLCYAAGGLVIVVYTLAFLLRTGIGSLRLTQEFVSAWGATLTNPAAMVIGFIDGFKTDWFTTLLTAAGLTVLALRFRPAVFLLAIYVPTLAQPTWAFDVAQTMRFFTFLMLFAPLFGALVSDRKTAFVLLATVWLPGCLMGAVAGTSSSNTGAAVGLGSFGGVVVTCILAARACEESFGRWRPYLGWTGIAAPLAFLWSLVGMARHEGAMYRDDPIEKLVAKVRVGPYRGIRTTPQKRAFVEQLHNDIVSRPRDGKYAVFLTDFNAGYLSANRQNAVADTWMVDIPKRFAINARIFRERAPDVGLVGMRWCGVGNQMYNCAPEPHNAPNNPLFQAIHETHEVVLKRNDYWLLERKRAPSAP